MNFFDGVQQALARRALHFAAATELRSVNDLFPGERAAVAGARESRQREFATGRWCARRLMAEMGIRCGAIRRGGNGEPIWPHGICGSITHAAGACCAIAASQTAYRSVGIDIERASRRISRPARRLFLNEDETDWISGQAAPRDELCLTVFSIKESVYKMLYPLVKKVVPFSAISARPWGDDGVFTCHVNVDLSTTIMRGCVLSGRRFRNTVWLLTVAALQSSDTVVRR